MSNVAVCSTRSWAIDAAGDQVSVIGSYSSALAIPEVPALPPVTSTSPLPSNVAV